jgi:hypothetical protein
MSPITIWFDSPKQAQEWKIILKEDHFPISDIASRKGKRFTIEIYRYGSFATEALIAVYPPLKKRIV